MENFTMNQGCSPLVNANGNVGKKKSECFLLKWMSQEVI
jgi:hypothetical protein